MEERQEKQTPTVELGGRLWELRFGHKAMRMFCRAAKCSLSNFDAALDSYDNQILLLWCVVQAQDSTVKREDLDDWLDQLLLEDVFEMIQDAIAAAMPRTAGKRLAVAKDAESAATEEAVLEEPENPTTETSSHDL